VLKAPTIVQAAFLRGLFEDGSVHLRSDGALDHIELFTAFPDLARDVKVLLLRLGIVSGYLKRKTGTTIYIYGTFAKMYGELVGFVTPYKKHRLTAPCGNATRYLVPVMKREIREVCDANGGPHRFMTSSDENVYNRGYMSRHGLQDFLRRAIVRTQAWEDLHARLSFHHSRVGSITPIEAPSFCFEVPEGHQFVQDGFCGWNSQGSEWETVVLPITRTQGRMLQRNLFYTAVTRAKKRVWLLGHKDAVARAVANDRVVQRNTAFARAISDAVETLKAAGVEAVDDGNDGGAEEYSGRLDAGTEGPTG
jgi:hypothetical protein